MVSWYLDRDQGCPKACDEAARVVEANGPIIAALDDDHRATDRAGSLLSPFGGAVEFVEKLPREAQVLEVRSNPWVADVEQRIPASEGSLDVGIIEIDAGEWTRSGSDGREKRP